VYLRAEGGTIPELKRVVVAHGNRVVMGETLEEGLAALFGGARVRPSIASQDTLAATPAGRGSGEAGGGALVSDAAAALLQEAQQHYDRAITAQRAGNWAEYGREIDQLGAVLRQLRAAGKR
jgi:uncharacterized membrane protein (UPF0182 family)